MFVILSAQKKIANVFLLGWFVSQVFLEGDYLRLSLRLGVNAQQKFDQLQPRIAPFHFLIARPDCIDRIVVITLSLFRLPLLRGNASKFEIYDSILRLSVP